MENAAHETAAIIYNPEDGVAARRDLANGDYLDLSRMLYNWRISVGNRATPLSYEDCWCFKDEATALAAFAAWDGEGEPPGWMKHPMSGRFRPDGDPAREVVNR